MKLKTICTFILLIILLGISKAVLAAEIGDEIVAPTEQEQKTIDEIRQNNQNTIGNLEGSDVQKYKGYLTDEGRKYLTSDQLAYGNNLWICLKPFSCDAHSSKHF